MKKFLSIIFCAALICIFLSLLFPFMNAASSYYDSFIEIWDDVSKKIFIIDIIYCIIIAVGILFSIYLLIYVSKTNSLLTYQEIQERKALKAEKKKQNKIEKLESKLNEMKKDG